MRPLLVLLVSAVMDVLRGLNASFALGRVGGLSWREAVVATSSGANLHALLVDACIGSLPLTLAAFYLGGERRTRMLWSGLVVIVGSSMLITSVVSDIVHAPLAIGREGRVRLVAFGLALLLVALAALYVQLLRIFRVVRKARIARGESE
jgi:hypothetical protein